MIELTDARAASVQTPEAWVADDDEGIRVLLAEMLTERGVRCSRQFPSAEALLAALASADPPDVILLDVNMDGMSGIEAIRLIKTQADLVRVFIMTTCFDSLNAAQARRNGAAGFFLKSDDLDGVVARLRDASRDWPGGALAPVPVDWQSEPVGCLLTPMPANAPRVSRRAGAAASGLARDWPPTPAWLIRTRDFLRRILGRESYS